MGRWSAPPRGLNSSVVSDEKVRLGYGGCIAFDDNVEQSAANKKSTNIDGHDMLFRLENNNSTKKWEGFPD